MEPTAFYDVAQTALDCICDQMTSIVTDDPTYPGCPCYAFVSPGEPSTDCCSVECAGPEGMLTVHIGTVFPSDRFPVRTEEFAPCKAATWVVELVVTASRCVPSTDEQGNPVSSATLSEAARIQGIDQYAIMTALGCCLVADAPPNKKKRRVDVDGSTSQMSEGGCGAVIVRARVEVGPVCACVEAS